MRYYTFLLESNDNIEIKFYQNTNVLNDKQIKEIISLWKQLDKVDTEFCKKIDSTADFNYKSPDKNELVNSNYMYVTAEIDNKIIGFSAIQYPKPSSVGKYAVRSLCVDNKYRGNGIGTRIMSFIKNKFKNKLFIKVVANNNPAYNLYKKSGFKPWLISMVMS